MAISGAKPEKHIYEPQEQFKRFLSQPVNLRYIQELLGHKSSKTMEIYTHVSNKDIGKIKSPLDSLQIREGGMLGEGTQEVIAYG